MTTVDAIELVAQIVVALLVVPTVIALVVPGIHTGNRRDP